MRDDELRQMLTNANPWWRAAATGGDATAAVRNHRLLRERARYDLGYRSVVFADIATRPLGDALIVLTGPRRVGKSVALLDLADSLCSRRDVDPRQVISVPCDELSVRDLRRVLTLGRRLTAAVDQVAEQRRVWLFDEISAVSGWTSALKVARGDSVFGDDTVIVTGSRWLPNEDVRGNLLAGRAGSGGRRVRHAFPLSFREFAAAAGRNLVLPSVAHPADLQSLAVRQELEGMTFEVDDCDLAWQDYMSCGGFPRAVAEHARNGTISDAFFQDVQAWLQQDVDPDQAPQSVPLLLGELTSRMTSPLSVRALVDSLGQGRTSVTTKLNRLVASFGALWCHQVDDGARRVPNAKSKLYLTDPLLSILPSHARAGLAPPDMTALTEAAIGVALARSIDALEEGRWTSGDTIGYVRTSSGNEVDLGPVAVPTPSVPRRTTPIESKWVDTGVRADSKTLEARYDAGVVVTKSVLDLDHPSWAVPAGLVAALLT